MERDKRNEEEKEKEEEGEEEEPDQEEEEKRELRRKGGDGLSNKEGNLAQRQRRQRGPRCSNLDTS